MKPPAVCWAWSRSNPVFSLNFRAAGAPEGQAAGFGGAEASFGRPSPCRSPIPSKLQARHFALLFPGAAARPRFACPPCIDLPQPLAGPGTRPTPLAKICAEGWNRPAGRLPLSIPFSHKIPTRKEESP